MTNPSLEKIHKLIEKALYSIPIILFIFQTSETLYQFSQFVKVAYSRAKNRTFVSYGSPLIVLLQEAILIFFLGVGFYVVVAIISKRLTVSEGKKLFIKVVISLFLSIIVFFSQFIITLLLSSLLVLFTIPIPG